MDNVAQGAGTTSVLVPSSCIPGKLYHWHARASNGTITTSYSTTESFRADNRGFINGQTIVDPLTNGQTVAHERHGGHFVSGDNGGWQADGPGDSLDYNIPTCSSCSGRVRRDELRSLHAARGRRSEMVLDGRRQHIRRLLRVPRPRLEDAHREAQRRRRRDQADLASRLQRRRQLRQHQ